MRFLEIIQWPIQQFIDWTAADSGHMTIAKIIAIAGSALFVSAWIWMSLTFGKSDERTEKYYLYGAATILWVVWIIDLITPQVADTSLVYPIKWAIAGLLSVACAYYWYSKDMKNSFIVSSHRSHMF